MSRLLQTAQKPPQETSRQPSPVLAKATSKTAAIFKFMSLPPEIRLIVLRKALIRSKPLRYVELEADGNLSSAINGWTSDALSFLATCKEIREEGSPLFFENNIFQISISQTHRFFAAYPTSLTTHREHRGLPKTIPPFLSRIKKLLVVLHPYPRHLDCDSGMDKRNAMHDTCALLTRIDVSQMSIEVRVKPGQEIDEDFTIEEILEPLAYLSGFRRASVQGVNKGYAACLESNMTNQKPIENIWEMRDAFLDWMEGWVEKGRVHWEDCVSADDAINDCDISKFKYLRKAIIGQARNAFIESTKRVLSHDL